MKRFVIGALVLCVCAPSLGRADETTFTSFQPATQGWSSYLGGGSTGPVGGNNVGGNTIGGQSVGGEGWGVGPISGPCVGRYPAVACLYAPRVTPPVTLPRVTAPSVTLPSATLPVVPIPVVPIPTVPCCNLHKEAATHGGLFSVAATSVHGEVFTGAYLSASTDVRGGSSAITWTADYTLDRWAGGCIPYFWCGLQGGGIELDASTPACAGGAQPSVVRTGEPLPYNSEGHHTQTLTLTCAGGTFDAGQTSVSLRVSFHFYATGAEYGDAEATGHLHSITFDQGA